MGCIPPGYGIVQMIRKRLLVLLFLLTGLILLSNSLKPVSSTPVQDKSIHVPVVLHPVRGSKVFSTQRTNQNILSLFAKTQNIWKQADIVFDVTIKEASLDKTLSFRIERGDYAVLAVSPDVNSSSLNIFFLKSLSGVNGIAISHNVAAVADRTTVNDFRATAHEIGHMLGLRHTNDDPNRLLFRGVNGTSLVEDEIRDARSVAQSFLKYGK